MNKKEFWEKVSEVWAKKQEIIIPSVNPGEIPPDDPSEEELSFDDIDELDDFFKDMFNDF